MDSVKKSANVDYGEVVEWVYAERVGKGASGQGMCESESEGVCDSVSESVSECEGEGE